MKTYTMLQDPQGEPRIFDGDAPTFCFPGWLFLGTSEADKPSQALAECRDAITMMEWEKAQPQRYVKAVQDALAKGATRTQAHKAGLTA